MHNYLLLLPEEFKKSYSKVTSRNSQVKKRIDSTLEKMTEDPFHPGLRTHKADTIKFGIKYSSRVTGDLRIIWEFKDNTPIILALTILGHEVYK